MVTPRVVSLVPSVTETLTDWGLVPIACTRFCERPDLPHVGGTKNPDIRAIVALMPDLVVVDRHENRREDADALARAGVPVHVMDVHGIDGLGDELSRLAVAVGREPPTPVVPTARPASLTAFVPIWRRPWMTIGPATYGSSLLAVLGVRNVFDGAATDYPEVTLDEAASLRPDRVLVPSEPYEFSDDHLAELSAVAPALRVDGRDLFWWGSRTAGALARLDQVIHEAGRRAGSS